VTGVAAEVDLKLPDIVTLSIQQAIAPNMRLLGTVEWSNWSRFEELRVKSTGTGATVLGAATPGSTVGVIDAKWSDGWFFSLGGEYDYSKDLMLRAGVAYEISPVDDPTKRIIGIPDSDRVWVSLGGTYKWSANTSFDFAYTHIFLDDARFTRTTLGTGLTLNGSVDAATDILSVSLKTKW
jgi:long-chain fatty acid transport protein